ncbi:MAG TPA: SIMPL domain-containing protein [Thermomicrobiaceae bacterium]|nr:SIMPL domain-containing protein [Thermomicrobiaceae bacterium]
MSNPRRLLLALGLIAALIVSAGLIGVLGGGVSNHDRTAAADTAPSEHNITVSGQGVVSVTPDTGQATLGVQVQNADLTAAQNQAAQTMTAIQNALKAQGVSQDKIKTVIYNISINRDQKDPNSSTITGYTVIDLVQFSIKPVDKLGVVLQAAIDAGANEVQGVGFTVEDTSAALGQARQRAMDDAHAKAQQLAQLAGVTLGPPIAVSEGVSYPPTPQEFSSGAATAAASSVPVQPGQTQISVTVTVSYGF